MLLCPTGVHVSEESVNRFATDKSGTASFVSDMNFAGYEKDYPITTNYPAYQYPRRAK